jgi:hypothetical protein
MAGGFCLYMNVTSILALVQRGISTTILNILLSASAMSGISWNGDKALPSFSICGVKWNCQMSCGERGNM